MTNRGEFVHRRGNIPAHIEDLLGHCVKHTSQRDWVRHIGDVAELACLQAVSKHSELLACLQLIQEDAYDVPVPIKRSTVSACSELDYRVVKSYTCCSICGQRHTYRTYFALARTRCEVGRRRNPSPTSLVQLSGPAPQQI